MSSFRLGLLFATALTSFVGCAAPDTHKEFCERIEKVGCAVQGGQSCDKHFQSTSEEFDRTGCTAELEAYFDCVAAEIERSKNCSIANDQSTVCSVQVEAMHSCAP